MKLTLGQLVAAAPAIEKIASADTPPIQTRLRIKQVMKAAQSELAMHEELRVALVRKYGTEHKDGTTVTWSVTPENVAVFGDEMQKLNASEVDLPCEPIPVNDLERTPVSAVDLIMLEPLLSE